MDDGQKVITIAHPEHSSGELKIEDLKVASRANFDITKITGTSLLFQTDFPSLLF